MQAAPLTCETTQHSTPINLQQKNFQIKKIWKFYYMNLK
jgi:hypothetical protein